VNKKENGVLIKMAGDLGRIKERTECLPDIKDKLDNLNTKVELHLKDKLSHLSGMSFLFKFFLKFIKK